MTAEILSRQMQNQTSSLERVAVRIKSMINGSRDFLKKNLDAQNCSVCVARYIAAMTTSQTSQIQQQKIKQTSCRRFCRWSHGKVQESSRWSS